MYTMSAVLSFLSAVFKKTADKNFSRYSYTFSIFVSGVSGVSGLLKNADKMLTRQQIYFQKFSGDTKKAECRNTPPFSELVCGRYYESPASFLRSIF